MQQTDTVPVRVNLAERFFDKLKHCRKVATRYDKLAACGEAATFSTPVSPRC